MKKSTVVVVALLALAVSLPGCRQQRASLVLASSQAEADQTPAQTVSIRTRTAAQAVIASLNDEQREQAVRPVGDPLRTDWHFIPRERQGVMLGDLDAQQKTRVHRLMQTALSDSGYLKATDIIWLEMLLYEMSNQNPMRDPGKYALLIFGDPADETAAWGWRLEGHHLSINLTYTPEGIGVTPLFFGASPAVVQQGPLAGKRVFADAHNLAIELAQSMSDEQRKKMMLAEKPRDVITGPGREASLKKARGIPGTELTRRQEMLLVALTTSHLMSVDMDHYLVLSQQWFGFAANGPPPSVHFSWAGPIDADKPFYYCIYGPGFVIEYSCQGRNHVHAVIHDLADPLQEDLLKKHFEHHEH